MTTENAIEIRNLSRTFRSNSGVLHALDHVTLDIPRGQVVAFLGVNGAGKTTLTRVLATILAPSSGSASVLGHDVAGDPRGARKHTGVVLGGDRGLYSMLTGRENLRYFGMLSGVPARSLKTRASEALETVGLEWASDQRTETYSKGMKQRLHIACGIIGHPSVLLLDEPTVGLDPLEARKLRDVVAERRREGVTIVLTSHQLVDISRLADRVVVLRSGAIAHDLSLPSFVALAGYAATVSVRLDRALSEPEAERLVTQIGAELVGAARLGDVDAQGKSEELSFPVRAWSPEVLSRLGVVFSAVGISDLRIRDVDLDDAFAAATMGTLADG